MSKGKILRSPNCIHQHSDAKQLLHKLKCKKHWLSQTARRNGMWRLGKLIPVTPGWHRFTSILPIAIILLGVSDNIPSTLCWGSGVGGPCRLARKLLRITQMTRALPPPSTPATFRKPCCLCEDPGEMRSKASPLWCKEPKGRFICYC